MSGLISLGLGSPASITLFLTLGLEPGAASAQVLLVGTLSIRPAYGAVLTVGPSQQGTVRIRPAITAALEVAP